MIVYADIVFITNFILNYFVLLGVSKASFIYTTKIRIIIAAILGAIYAIFMFDKRLSCFYIGAAKITVSVILILISFKIISLKNFIKICLYYYIISFAFAGAATFVNQFTGVIKMVNGTFYFKNSFWILLASTIISYYLVSYLLKIFKKSFKRHCVTKDIIISMEGKSVVVKGMLDTGNTLLDPISLYPVIVVEFDHIKDILPLEITEFLKEGNTLNCNINRRYLNKIRLIPYNSVGTNSILKGFKPDYVRIIDSENKLIKDVIIAVIYKKLSNNNEFNAVLNPMY